MYFGNNPIRVDARWNWHNEVQYRNYNFIGDLDQLLLRTGVGYNLTQNNNNLLLGYAYVITSPYTQLDTKTRFYEHRLFLQFIHRHKLSTLSIQHRFRFEQRHIEDRNTQWRGRYFLSANLPIFKIPKTASTVYLSAYNELFLNFQNKVFDRNRMYAAAGYQFNPWIKVEAGFMTQIFRESKTYQFQLGLYNTVPFVKGKAKNLI